MSLKRILTKYTNSTVDDEVEILKRYLKISVCPKRVGSFGHSTLASEEKASEK